MKTKLFLLLAGVAIVAIGCVSTVNDRHAAAIPLVKDKAAGRYNRSVDQVFTAAKTVLANNGTVSRASDLLGGTNMVRALEGKVNNRNVWIRVEGVDPKITEVIVQARSSWGVADQPLTHQLEKEIALELAR